MIQEDTMRTDGILYQHSISNDSQVVYEPHCHTMGEIYYLIDGEVECTVEGTVYYPKPGSLLLIAPQRFHSTKVISDKNYHRIRIHFLPEFLKEDEREILMKPFYRKQIYYKEIEGYHLEHYLEEIGSCIHLDKEIQDIAFRTRIEALLTQIFAMSSETEEGDVISNEAAQNIIVYINEHLTENMTLELLSERFFVSKNHLTTIFKRATGTTVANYILFKRVALAQEYIMKGDSLTDAAFKSGFNDYSSFYRSYKKVCGSMPSKRKDNRIQI